MIPTGTEISAATPVITIVPTIAWAAPPPLMIPCGVPVRNSQSSPGSPRLVTW